MGQEIRNITLCPEFWASEWRSAIQNSTVSRRKHDDIKWIKFWDLLSEYYEVSEGVIKNIIETMLREGIINKKSKVLDIGCGPGTFTIPFSKIAKQVDAIDPSRNMLNKISKRKMMGIKNINLINSKWEDFNSQEKYDVVAAFCPAINNIENL